MNFNLSEEQGQIRDSIARFVSENYTFEQRNLVVAQEHGFSAEHWQQFAELGWLSVPFSGVMIRLLPPARQKYFSIFPKAKAIQ